MGQRFFLGTIPTKAGCLSIIYFLINPSALKIYSPNFLLASWSFFIFNNFNFLRHVCPSVALTEKGGRRVYKPFYFVFKIFKISSFLYRLSPRFPNRIALRISWLSQFLRVLGWQFKNSQACFRVRIFGNLSFLA